MRYVLISLKPYYYYLIGENIKKVEVRKTYPKAKDWSRNSLFYMSRDEKSFAKIPKEFQEKYRKHFGKVGMRFVCDRIDEFVNLPLSLFAPIYTLVQSCLTTEQIREYLNGKNGYGWHITDLVVYDKPRELVEFFQVKAIRGYHKKDEPKTDGINVPKLLQSSRIEVNFLTRPPQSWCYIEPR